MTPRELLNYELGAPEGNSRHAGHGVHGGARRAGAGTYNPLGQQPKQEKCFYSPSEARTVTQRPALCTVEVRRALSMGLWKDTSVTKGHCVSRHHRSHSRNGVGCQYGAIWPIFVVLNGTLLAGKGS
jgi:hypothetical protein